MTAAARATAARYSSRRQEQELLSAIQQLSAP